MSTKPAAFGGTSLIFPVVAGLFFFVVILKFGNPVVLDSRILPPEPGMATWLESWPPHWAPWLFPPLALAALFSLDWKRFKFHWVALMPLLWLGWECLSAMHTINAPLTQLTLTHFAVCVGLFYIGCFATHGMDQPWPVWVGIGLALVISMRTGLEQHFGGLEATRKWMETHPESLSAADAEMMKDPQFKARLLKGRIYGTFAVANTFAGAIVLLMPVTLVFLWRLTPKVRRNIRILFLLILGGCGAACLYWSGSKAGWLVALLIGLVAMWHSALPKKWKFGLVFGCLILGIAGFCVKYSSYFRKDYNSVSARFGYWRAARIITEQHPMFGTGPGTFQTAFIPLIRPTDEPTKLAHNDYLEQACDSGILGAVFYILAIFGLLTLLYRYFALKSELDWVEFGVWLGLFGLCLHSIVDFHLYVTSIAWPMFFLFGWLYARQR